MRYLTLLLVFLLSSCFGQALKEEPTDNKEFKVDLLFKHDGCSVYRFGDSGYHYFVKCDSVEQHISEEHMEACGKGCGTVRSQETPTIIKKRRGHE